APDEGALPIRPVAETAAQITRRYTITMNALSDQPTINDLLGFEVYAEALVKFIEDPNTEKPLAIAIDAPWGMGKSSLMRMIEQRLAGQRNTSAAERANTKPKNALFPTVWFNAWQYDQSEAIWANLVLEILVQVQARLNPWQRFLMKLRLDSKRFDWQSLLQNILQYLLIYGLFIGLLGLLVTGTALLFTDSTLLGVWQQTQAYIDLVGLGAFFATIAAVGKEAYDNLTKPLNLKLEEYFKRPDYQEKAGFLNQFQTDFKRVVELVTENGRWPLVIFIDDLDRCEPPKLVEIVEAINLLLDSRHCVFILGMDTRTVASSIEAKYKDMLQYLERDSSSQLSFGQQFLEKIIQIRFRIPRATADTFRKFITGQLMAGSEGEYVEETTELRHNIEQIAAQIKAEQRQSGQSAQEATATLQARASMRASAGVIQAAQKQVQADEALFDQSEAVQEAIVAAASYLDYSPRQVKRFINLYRLQAFIAQQRGLLEREDFELGLLGRWLILSMGWPRIATQVRRDKDFISRFQQAADLTQRLKQHWDKADSEKDQTYEALKTDLTARLEDALLADFVEDNHLRRLLDELKDVKNMRLYLDMTEISADPAEE
ncbi:MAG TPA: P-loop NTPase fold protein, partial [Anaerolineae bacterium]